MSTDEDEYFEYLTRRSTLGYLYRKFIFHPRIVRYVEGNCLDVGCGIGDFVYNCPNCTGVEINDKLVSYCRARGLDVSLSLPEKLPLISNSVDTVLLDNVLEHLADPSELLCEISRVLRSSGRFIVGVPGVKGYASDPDHKIFYDDGLLTSTVEPYGYRLEKMIHMPIAGLSARLNSFCYFGIFRALD